MITNESATCIDCGLDVTYNDGGFWPWRGIDGSDTCTSKANVRWGHRVPNTEAQEIFAAFTARTGRAAAHA